MSIHRPNQDAINRNASVRASEHFWHWAGFVANGATSYVGPAGANASADGSCARPSFAGTITSLFFNTPNTPPASNTFRVVVVINGVETALTYTNNPGSYGGVRVTGLVQFSRADVISAKCVAGANAGTNVAVEIGYSRFN